RRDRTPGSAARAPEPGRHPALLRRPDHARDRRGARHLAGNRRERLAYRTGLVERATPRGRGGMTPQRWQRINELFEAASRIDPSRRQDWLEGVCDAELRDDVARLLANDERARREGFLTLKTAPGQAIDPGTISVTRGADGWAAPAGRAGHETV